MDDNAENNSEKRKKKSKKTNGSGGSSKKSNKSQGSNSSKGSGNKNDPQDGAPMIKSIFKLKMEPKSTRKSAASSNKTEEKSSGKSNKPERLVSQCQNIPLRLAEIFIERIRLVAEQYQSFYIAIYEITLYEILVLILRQCLKGGSGSGTAGSSGQTTTKEQTPEEDNAETVEKKKYAKLMKIKYKDEKNPKTKTPEVGGKRTTLVNILNKIRTIDASGQMTQFIGLPHLWCQFSSFTKIVPNDLTVFHHFISANYVNVLHSETFGSDDTEGLVWILNESHYTEKRIHQATEKVDSEIVRILQKWSRKSNDSVLEDHPVDYVESNSDNKSKNHQNPKNPKKSSKKEEKDCDDSHKLTRKKSIIKPESEIIEDYSQALHLEQEKLGQVYMVDYLHRWYMKRCASVANLANTRGNCCLMKVDQPKIDPDRVETQKSSEAAASIAALPKNPNKPEETVQYSDSAFSFRKVLIRQKRKVLKEKEKEIQRLLSMLAKFELSGSNKASGPKTSTHPNVKQNT